MSRLPLSSLTGYAIAAAVLCQRVELSAAAAFITVGTSSSRCSERCESCTKLFLVIVGYVFSQLSYLTRPFSIAVILFVIGKALEACKDWRGTQKLKHWWQERTARGIDANKSYIQEMTTSDYA